MIEKSKCVAAAVVLPALAAAASAQVVGWRTDGSGKYASAAPPVEWSTEKNVIWKTPLPAGSNATPIIVGERIFVCAEPTDLICLRRSDGKLLWTRSNTLEQCLTPEQVAKAAEDVTKAEPVWAERRKRKRALRKAQAALKKKPKDPKLKAEAKAREEEVEAIEKRLEGLTMLARPLVHKVTGCSTPTPVSDGRRVFVHNGHGVVACYGLDGGRKWIRFVEKPVHRWAGHSNSPLLVGDKIIVHITDVVALDAATGKELWRTKSKWHDVFGSPLHVRAGGMNLYVDPNGDVLRVADGHPLARALCYLELNAPVFDGGVLYFIRNGGKAFRLPRRIGEKLELKPLWTLKITDDRYYGSPVVHDGLIYAVTRVAILSVIDAATGKVVYKRKLPLGDEKDDMVYSSVTLAGKHLYVSHENGTTVVLAAGREFRQVALNKLELFRSCPVFAGDRMYIRAAKHLYCIGSAEP